MTQYVMDCQSQNDQNKIVIVAIFLQVAKLVSHWDVFNLLKDYKRHIYIELFSIQFNSLFSKGNILALLTLVVNCIVTKNICIRFI